jgi:hypothetical protein
MNLFFLTKATIVCAGSAFIIYSFPVVSQAVIIAVLTVLWVSCAHQALRKRRRPQL